MDTLVELPYSPWSEKARFALDHHRHAYRRETYKPMIGELPLRARTGKWTGRVSVPVLLTDGGAIFDSLAIAKHAESKGSGRPLFPRERVRAIESWNATSEEALEVGRKLALLRSLESPEAQRDGLEGIVPAALRTALRPVALTAVRYLEAKYGARALDPVRLETALVALRAALSKSGDYLLGDFTYADITMAAVLQVVAPPASVSMSRAIRATFTDAVLAERYPDLIAWRDRIYAKHRGE